MQYTSAFLRLVLVSSVGASVSLAQQRQTPDPIAITAEAAAIDPYAPGSANYSRYTTASLCVAAADDAFRMSRRTVASPQAMKKNSEGVLVADTLPTNVVTVARNCGAHFTTETVPPSDLIDLFKLALYERRDSLARVAAERALASATTDVERRSALSFLVATLVTGPLANTAWAESLAVQVLGNTDTARKMMARLDTSTKPYGSSTGRFGAIPKTTPVNVPGGKVTLILEEPQGCRSGYGNAGCNDTQGWALVRRLRTEYDSTQLSIVLIVRVTGTSLDVAQSPTEEEAALRWFFLEYQKLPVTLSLMPVSYTRYPAPDGRLVASEESQGPSWLNIRLVGRDGSVLFDGGREKELDAALHTALATSATGK